MSTTEKKHIEEASVITPVVPDPADALRAFETSITLYTYQGGIVWASFNAMIVVHSILVATAALVIMSIPGNANAPALQWIVRFIVAIGISVTIAWLAITARGFGYQDDILRTAQDLEKAYFSIHIFPFHPILRPKLLGLGRIPVRWSAYITIGLFGLIYIGAFIMSFP